MNTVETIQQLLAEDWQRYQDGFRRAIVVDDNPMLEYVWEYVSARPGKQIRPMLVLLSAGLCRGITDKTIDTAIAMELMHNASLVHDDVVDHSPTRRGQQAVHEEWTNKVAVLSGDYMLARVIDIAAKIRNHRILQIVANIGKDLSNGELLQLHHNSSMWISREQYYHIIELKTGSLFAACTEAGAESAAATDKARNAMRRFGMELGICFQIVDDILDYQGDEGLGKERMQDIRDGKVTLPLIIAAERAGEHPADDAAVEQIRDFVLRYDGIGGARREMEAHKKSALEALRSFHHNSLHRQALEDLLNLCCNRIA